MNTDKNRKNGFVPYEGSLAEKAHNAGPAACLLKFPPSGKSDTGTDTCPRCGHKISEHGK